MGDKDITERSLEWFNDVFSDIVNAWFAVNGVKGFTVMPDDLQDALTRTAYKSGGELRDIERDVAKLWTSRRGKALICLLGLENQTAIDTYMALRVFGYEGGDYRLQLLPVTEEDGRSRKKKPHLVLTLVLYFGTKRRWPKRRSVLDRLNAPEELRRFFSDTPLNVFELAFLTEEQEAYFKSDFRYVVHLLRQERLGEKLDMPPGEIKHAVELMELFFSLTGDLKFRDAIKKAQDMEKRGEPLNMRSFLTEAMNDGIAIGRNEGITIGEERAKTNMRSFLTEAMNDGIAIGERRGEARGISIGRNEGITIGRNEGMTLGRQEERKLIMERLIAGGISPQQAAAFTGMNV